MSPGTVDFILGVVLFVFTIKGFMAGFIRTIATLLALLVAWAVMQTSPNLTAFALGFVIKPQAPLFPLVTHVATFSVVYIVVQFIGFLLTGLIETIGLGLLDKLAGLVLGFVTGVLAGCIPLFILYMLPSVYAWAPVQTTIRHSFFLTSYTPIVRQFERPPQPPAQPRDRRRSQKSR